jgi:tRNA threonylcarbamoyladenosine biosynthesis protein TsaB
VKANLVLGIETSGRSTGLALVENGRVVAELTGDSDCGHNEVLMPLLDRLLREAGVAPDRLAGIGVDVGPGMFTSLRVGVSTAKGLAIARRIPVVGVGSLWALARTARPAMDRVLSVIDARKSQVYAALYLAGEPALSPAVLSPAELASAVASSPAIEAPIYAAGNGTAICAPPLAAVGIEVEPSDVTSPAPAVIAFAAAERIAGARADSLAAVEPRYLRRTDAELVREKKLAKKG